MQAEELLGDTVEYLVEELRKAVMKIEDIATKVNKGELGAYEGFMETEKHNNRILELGKKLKEKGLDITQMEF
ncbi:hypothetical protein [Sulfurimonas sp.]|jgi:hypothetical protein|uniref:hypothetical protein n=1 Tax=Sulfurimonas sp. TaxID=2022749 RepID=UPI003D0EAA6D